MREGYKKTKLGVIPKEWKIVKLDRILDTFGGYAFKSSKFKTKKYHKAYQVIRMGNVQMGVLETEKDPVYLDEIEIDENRKRYILSEKDILISLTGTVNKRDYGNVCYITEDNKYVVNQRVGCIRSKSDDKSIINKYIYYFMQSNVFRNQFFILGIGGTGNQANVSLKDMNEIDIVLPLYQEQSKIASILSSVDEHIEEVDGMIEDLKELKKGLMQKLLTGQYTIENGKLVKTKEFKKTRLGMIPKSWELKNLFEVVDVIMGQSPKSENYNENNDGLPLIQGNADCKNRKTSPRVYTSQITKKCVIGDIIMTVRAPVGAVSKSYHNACIGRGVCALQPRDIDSEYLFQYMIKVEDSWSRLSQGSTFTAINSKDVKNFKVLVPPLKEQKKVASILSSVDLRIAIYKAEKQDLQQLKKGLMQQLLTGKVRVKV